MDYITLLDFAIDLGYELAMNGAETFRVEETVSRVLSAYGVESDVFAIPNHLIVTVRTDDRTPITRMRRIGVHGNDLDAVEKFSGLSRACCNRVPEPKEAKKWLAYVRSQRVRYSTSINYLGNFLGGSGFAMLFGGSLTDAFFAGICGILVGFVNNILEKLHANPFFRTIATSFLMALVAYGFGALELAPNVDSVIIGALMLLVPGLLFTNAMRDIIYGDINSGINRIVQVFLTAVAIALGTAVAWRVAGHLWGIPVSAAVIQYSIPAHCLFALVGCIGFSILFNIHGPGGLLCALGGVLSWAVYLIALKTGCNDIIAYFWSALFASFYSEIMARIRKCPAISYLVVSIFPMIPGAGAYYTMNYAVRGQMEQFAAEGMHTIAIAGILAVGILLVSTTFRMYADHKLKKK
jgi:uncharacterized membrane protein YjjP (DUF1212 family)